MESDRIKWNERYSGDRFWFSLSPSRFLAECLELVKGLVPGRRALDIACGEGRNAIFLAENGFDVDAVDIAELGLQRGMERAEELGLRIEFIQADLELYRLEKEYDLIVDFNFLLRPLIPEMVRALSPGGVIIMETILNAPPLPGGHKADFLLQPGELVSLFSGFEGEVLKVEEEPFLETPLARVIYRKSVARG